MHCGQPRAAVRIRNDDGVSIRPRNDVDDMRERRIAEHLDGTVAQRRTHRRHSATLCRGHKERPRGLTDPRGLSHAVHRLDAEKQRPCPA